MMILGIDWGKRKIGLAIAHEDMAIATSYDIIENDDEVFNTLKDIIAENEVHLIVIGRSEHRVQDDNVAHIDQFAEKCHEILDIPIEFEQEMFSTREAQNNLIAAGKKKISQKDDAESARVILQQYLDVKKEKM